MSRPTGNVLTLLELLQARPQVRGDELARRLGVGARQLRRYVTTLQDLGIPVETVRGRYGGYRLAPGYRLPPLMLTDDEAVALTLGLLAVQRLNLASATPAVEGTLAKVQRVLPNALQKRVRALEENLVLSFDKAGAGADSTSVATLSAAAREGRRVFLRYRAWRGAETAREVDPYGVVYFNEAWFVVGYCHLRQAVRSFRLDRVLELAVREETFAPAQGFDTLAHVEKAVASAPGAYAAEIVLRTSLEAAQQKVPGWLATLEALREGVRMRVQVREALDLPWLAHFLAGLGWSLVVREPPELREALKELAQHTTEIATT